jgi:peptidoglycan/xylan/chitin deacetylase (PgdA/CDA1 family)
MRISLTFDDGPNLDVTSQILDLLELHKIPASFFLIGNNINEKSAESIRREIDDGCSVECHSWSHPAFPKLTSVEMLDEIEKTNAAIEKYSGEKPIFFRPPYIAVNQLMFDTIRMPFIEGRGVDDWNDSVSVETRVEGVVKNAHDGQIILLHDMSGNQKTVEALKKIIPALKDRGAEFYTVRDLFKVCGVNPNQKNKIWTDLF